MTADARPAGIDMVLLAAGDYHHHIGLNTFDSAGAPAPPPGHTGLYHVAFLYPDRRELGRAVGRLLDHGYPVDHGSDHGGTVSVYLADPDGNGVELYYDRPRAEWFDLDGNPVLKNERSTPATSCERPRRRRGRSDPHSFQPPRRSQASRISSSSTGPAATRRHQAAALRALWKTRPTTTT